jgi:threonine/homoserine/homoserine lactone efflux protein
MDLQIWLAYALACFLLLIIPGPTILTVISYSISQGPRVRLPLISAVALGDTLALFLSLAGLGTLLAQSAFWFQVAKWCGGLYLIYLGIKMFRQGFANKDMILPDSNQSNHQLFTNTFLITAFNPKGIIFFIAFLPQFVTPGETVLQQLIILGSTFVILGTLNAWAYAIFSSQAHKLLESDQNRRKFHFGGGTLLALAGGWALTTKAV